MNTFSRFISGLATIAVLTVGAGHAQAAASSLYINPASGSYQNGSSFSVSIIEAGDAVNVVTVNLGYDAAKLTCNGVGGGAFGGEITATCGGGSVSISRYVTPGQPALNGAQVVGTLNFTALAGSGTTSLNFGSSQVASNGVNTLSSSTGATYSFTSPTTTTPTTPSTGTTTTTRLNPATSTSSTRTNTPSSNSTTNVLSGTPETAKVLADTQKNTSKKAPTTVASQTATTSSSNVGRNVISLITLIAVATGIIAAQRYRANQLASAAASAALKTTPANTKKTSGKTVASKKTANKTKRK